MTLSEIIVSAGRRTNKPVSNSDVKNRFIDHVNFAREIAWDEHDWSFKKRVWTIRTYDQITSGTVTVTNGSSTVTASASVFSSPYVGGYFRVASAIPPSWYRIIAQGGTTLTIDPPYQGSSGSGISYETRKLDYLVPSEIFGQIKVTDSSNREISVETVLSRPTIIPDTRGKPTRAVMWSDDPIGSTYTTGTISGTINTRTVTGSGTSWLTTITPGDQLEVSVASAVYKYIVRSVESDTSLTLYQFLRTAISASTYVIRNQFSRIVRLAPSPDDEYVIAFHGTRHLYPLAHDDDTDELLTYYSSAIIEGIIGFEQGSSPDNREDSQIKKFFALLGKKSSAEQRESFGKNPSPISIPWGSYRA